MSSRTDNRVVAAKEAPKPLVGRALYRVTWGADTALPMAGNLFCFAFLAYHQIREAAKAGGGPIDYDGFWAPSISSLPTVLFFLGFIGIHRRHSGLLLLGSVTGFSILAFAALSFTLHIVTVLTYGGARSIVCVDMTDEQMLRHSLGCSFLLGIILAVGPSVFLLTMFMLLLHRDVYRMLVKEEEINREVGQRRVVMRITGV